MPFLSYANISYLCRPVSGLSIDHHIYLSTFITALFTAASNKSRYGLGSEDSFFLEMCPGYFWLFTLPRMLESAYEFPPQNNLLDFGQKFENLCRLM